MPAGEVKRAPTRAALKLPHIGWNEVLLRAARLLALAGGAAAATLRPFYHVHSYAPVPADTRDVAGQPSTTARAS